MHRLAIVFSLALVVHIAAADDRLFVRTSSDGTQTEIGAKATQDAQTRTIRFTLAEAESELWPEPATVTIWEGATSSVWTIALRSRVATRPHRLRAPRGTYEIEFSAPHHRTLHRNVHLDNADADLGTLTLIRFPVLTGSVRAPDGSPILGAFVTDRSRLSAKTDHVGAFALEIDGDWPSRLEVSYPGMATKGMTVPRPQASVNLPTITLSKGSRIGIEIEGLTGDVDVDLKGESGYKRLHVLKTAHLGRDTPRVTFEDVDRGEYIVVIRGGGPLQKLGTRVAIGEAESVTKEIRVEPIAVDIEVRRGESPLANAFVTVQNDQNRWSSDLQTNSEGRVSTEAWERGQYAFVVRATEKSVPLFLLDRIEGTSEATIRLDVPDRTIAGRVIDDADGSPIAKAAVNVESRNDDTTGGTMTAVTDADGKFVIDGLRDGSHTLVVEAEKYLRSEPAAVRIDQTSPRRDMDLRLSRGVSRELRVTTRNGLPIRGAIVIAMVGNAVTGIFTTDELGHATLHTQPGQTSVLYVLPAEGSFAIARLGSKPDSSEDLVVVPAGSATLELRANDSSGKPIPHLRFVMRYDGELIPPDVVDVLEMRRGIAAVTGADGVARLDRLPPGLLELWPVRGSEELQNVIASGALSAPVQVALKEGLNVASMTFSRKR